MGKFEEMLDKGEKKRVRLEEDETNKQEVAQVGSIDEFERMMGELDEEYGRQRSSEVVELEVENENEHELVYEPNPAPSTSSRTVSTQTRKARKIDRKTTEVMSMLGVDWTRRFAHEITASRSMFNSRNIGKPRWAVMACVLLRDQGTCKICGDNLRSKWKIVQLIPPKLNGTFNELNCVTICGECYKCWNKYKNFYTGLGEDVSWRRQKLYVMRRRNTNYQGCRPLAVTGLQLQRKLLIEEERYKLQIQDEGKEMRRLVESRKVSLRELIKNLSSSENEKV